MLGVRGLRLGAYQALLASWVGLSVDGAARHPRVGTVRTLAAVRDAAQGGRYAVAVRQPRFETFAVEVQGGDQLSRCNVAPVGRLDTGRLLIAVRLRSGNYAASRTREEALRLSDAGLSRFRKNCCKSQSQFMICNNKSAVSQIRLRCAPMVRTLWHLRLAAQDFGAHLQHAPSGAKVSASSPSDASAGMIRRRVLSDVRESLRSQAAVALIGPRQVGKTTLARQIADEVNGVYFDLESTSDRSMMAEPALNLEPFEDKLVVLDEIHRAPRDLSGTARND